MQPIGDDRVRRREDPKSASDANAHGGIAAVAKLRDFRPKLGAALEARQQGQPAAVIPQAWKDQLRLRQPYCHLAYRKRPQIAVVAVARELVGFLWAVMRRLESAAA